VIIKLPENRFLADGRLDVSTPDPMTAFGTDIVGRGDLDLQIGLLGGSKRAQLSGHPRRPRRGTGSLRASVRFVGCERSLHLPAAARAAASPAEQGADAGPQLDERPGLSGKAIACVHSGASIGVRRDPDNLKKLSSTATASRSAYRRVRVVRIVPRRMRWPHVSQTSYIGVIRIRRGGCGARYT
jgi:hypothetical protein